VSASLPANARNPPSKNRRGQAITVGREMTWLLTAASARRLRELTQTISLLEAEIAQLVPRSGS
jgi:hypothetical protein